MDAIVECELIIFLLSYHLKLSWLQRGGLRKLHLLFFEETWSGLILSPSCSTERRVRD